LSIQRPKVLVWRRTGRIGSCRLSRGSAEAEPFFARQGDEKDEKIFLPVLDRPGESLYNNDL
ncbi:hypothetical protein ACTNCI_11030, partial [Mitsuokella jalaludinii]|uniref:hypothetical protein n=1 Tax=Mitsuokella jalaludinii TaxID=187979 RepID=UPI003F8B8EB6